MKRVLILVWMLAGCVHNNTGHYYPEALPTGAVETSPGIAQSIQVENGMRLITEYWWYPKTGWAVHRVRCLPLHP